MKPRNKYRSIHIALNEGMEKAVMKECFEHRMTKQEFIRGLIADYFWRKKGFDIFFQSTNAKRNESDAG